MSEGVSIIVPIYNAEQFIELMVESVKGQTKEEWELILVDDGSEDDSLACCMKLEHDDSRIHVIHQDNQGPDAARLEGIRTAKYDYIMFLDADDLLEYQAIDVLYNNIINTEADIVISRFEWVWPDGSKKTPFNGCKPSVVDQELAIKYLFKQEYYGWELVGKLYKRKLFSIEEKINEKLVYMEDFYRNWYLFNEAKKISIIPDITYKYIQHDKSSTHQKFNEEKLSILRILNTIDSDERVRKVQNEFDELYIKRFAKVLCSWIFSGFDTQNINKYIEMLKEKTISSSIDLSIQNEAAVNFLLNYDEMSLVKAKRKLINDIAEFAAKHKEVYIYGAGRYAKVLGEIITESNINFSGFIVSNGEYAPKSPDGVHVVKFIHDYKKENNGLIIALSEANYNQVIKVLKQQHISDYLDLRKYTFLLNE